MVSLFAEVLPRLGCVNVAISGQDVDTEEVRMVTQGLMVGETRLVLPEQCQCHDTITGLHSQDNMVSFRLQLLNKDRNVAML